MAPTAGHSATTRNSCNRTRCPAAALTARPSHRPPHPKAEQETGIEPGAPGLDDDRSSPAVAAVACDERVCSGAAVSSSAEPAVVDKPKEHPARYAGSCPSELLVDWPSFVRLGRALVARIGADGVTPRHQGMRRGRADGPLVCECGCVSRSELRGLSTVCRVIWQSGDEPE
jgi:hypothetical protein